MSVAPAGNALDLEKELSCSICTDILFQPLTLLDCLHTFCGSCLKEWFSWQATAARGTRNAQPYTCPSCRAPVRAARPNANVTTLLDLYMQANPGKGKSEQEMAESKKLYTPGDDVIPPVTFPEGSDDDSEDERLLEQVREMSVADIDPAVEANRRDARRNRRPRAGNSPRDREIRRREDRENARRRQDAVERNVTHQSSLRSLLSPVADDPLEIRQEILTSILSSGLLDNVDIDSLSPEQEEELSERIANAYRERHNEIQQMRRQERPTVSAAASGGAVTTAQQTNTPRQPLSQQWGQDSAGARRPVSQGRAQAGATPPRSASGTSALTASPPQDTSRLANMNNERQAAQQLRVATGSQATPRRSTESRRENPQAAPPQQRSSSNPISTATTLPYPTNDAVSHLPAPGTSDHLPTQQRLEDSPFALELAIAIPHVSCDRCNKAKIQHELHYHCDKCRDGNFDLCLQCYRQGVGCDHWWGFGYAAQARFERSAPEGGWPAGYARPHVLTARRYRPRTDFNKRTDNLNTWKSLQEGAYCERCRKCANELYWHCTTCMEGAWGFCGECVQQSKHCTHPLLPTTYELEKKTDSVQVHLPHMQPGTIILAVRSTGCDVCQREIPRQEIYLHCGTCKEGDYDMCTNCHRTLVATGKIAAPPEQRQCLQGHSMELLQFQATPEGLERRVVVADKSAMSSGTDTRRVALWAWFPADDIDDELAFPKWAELRDVKKMNDDYDLGTYAGDIGLFPSNHVRAI